MNYYGKTILPTLPDAADGVFPELHVERESAKTDVNNLSVTTR